MQTDTRLPLFPLKTVLFPAGGLQLQIFELRYLEMIKRVHGEGRPFGVVALQSGDEVRRRDFSADPNGPFATEAFHLAGTVAHVERLDRPQPGLLAIRCRGGARFRLEDVACEANGLWTGRPAWLPDDPQIDIPPDLDAMRIGLARVLTDMDADAEDVAPQPTPSLLRDCGWVANRWCELLPLPLELRQQLLMVDSPLLRLELVTDALEQLQQGSSPTP